MQPIIPYVHSDNEPELQELIALRRRLHQFPEPGFSEFRTTALICDDLERLGYELHVGRELYDDAAREAIQPDNEVRQHAYEQVCAHMPENRWLKKMHGGFTGVVAHLKSGKPGPTFGFRVDIDGLELEESADEHHRPVSEGFASSNGRTHACGHDGHTSIGLGLARRIADHIDELAGEYWLFFQPAEESTSFKTSGGRIFANLACVKELDYFLALHLGIVPERTFVCGLSFLSQKKYFVRFQGSSAHAAKCPERGRNALLAACCAINNLYAIARHGDGRSRLNIGKFVSDNPSNVIASHTRFELEARGETDTIREYMVERAHAIIQGAAAMHDVQAECELKGEWVTAENSPELMPALRQAAVSCGIPEEAVRDEYFVSGCEDATYLIQAVQQHGGQAAMLCLGSPYGGGHHTATFDFDEDLMLWGIRVLWEFTKRTSAAT